MKAGCDTCDTQGPEISEATQSLRELHRAWHELGRELLEPFVRLLDTLTKRGN